MIKRKCIYVCTMGARRKKCERNNINNSEEMVTGMWF